MAKRKFYQKKRVMIPSVIGLALILLGIFGAFHSSLHLTTTNAYVDEYSIKVTPQMSAKIIELNLENNALVKKGEIVAELDGSQYEKRIKDLESDFYKNKAELEECDNEIGEINKKSKNIKIEFELARTDLQNANDDYVRYKNAYKDKAVTKKDLEKAVKNLDLAQEQYEEAKEKLAEITSDLKSALARKDLKITESQKYLEELENSKLELSNATIISPKSGKIVNLSAKVGDVVQVDKVLFEILPDECYVSAQFKNIPENKVKIGQKATIKIYSLGFKKFEGVVDAIDLNEAKKKEIRIKIPNCTAKGKIKTGAKAYVKIKIK